MGVDPSVVGRSYPPSPVYEVGREKIREFAEAIGDPDPVYRDSVAAQRLGHADVIAPPTFPIVLTLPASMGLVEELGLDFSRVVHGDQRFAYRRPLRAGDRLRSTVTVERVRSMADSDLITTRTDLATEDGETVAQAWSTLVARGAAGAAS
jgi:acyl dehydratase